MLLVVFAATGVVVLISVRAFHAFRQRGAVGWPEYCDLWDDWATYTTKVILAAYALMMLVLVLLEHPPLGVIAFLIALCAVFLLPILLLSTHMIAGMWASTYRRGTDVQE